MGLEDFPATPPPPATEMAVSPAVEKRRKLLGALEKCDEDLKALKKVIEAVRATQTPPRVAEMEAEERESEVGSDGPSPVSVLDHHRLSSTYSKRSPNEQIMQQQQHKPKQPKPQHMTRKKPGDHEDKAINFMSKPSFSVVLTTIPQPLNLHPSRSHQFLNHGTTTSSATSTPTPWSAAMKESVIEVCRDVEWGQRQEVGRIGLVLQDSIFRELVDDIIKDMSSCFRPYRTCKLPFEAWKRKLSF
ncbi:Translation initiation factor IF-2 [Bienertia sinuspersici]